MTTPPAPPPLQLHSDTIERAKKLLKMPPVLPEREERGKELQVDPRLNRFDDYNWVFVDISMGKEDKVSMGI